MKKLLLIGLLLIGLPISVACSSRQAADNAAADSVEPVAVQQAEDQSTVDSSGPDNLSIARSMDLSDREIDDLLYMREEEKLAHDVYAFLYERWGLPVFNNIADSEQTHTSSVLTLLERYGIDDPAAGLGQGQFKNTDLQSLYAQLIEQGSQSLVDALKVGAAIEEIDILDLHEANGRTDQADILLVYDNLLQGSYNHLRSFVNTLNQQTGEDYQPQYLSVEEFQAILAGSTGNGMGNGGQGQPAGGGRGNPNRN